MSRSLSTIYNEAVTARDSYMQLTELEPAYLTSSKVSILNLITYIVSVVIFSYETILDLFEVDMNVLLNQRMVGTASYYVYRAKLFQFDTVTQTGDTLQLNEQTYQMEYTETNTDHQIIEKAAYQYEDDDTLYDMTIKVCKANTNNNEEAALYVPLTSKELTSFKSYIENIKYVGTSIKCISRPGDILTVKALIYYNSDSYLGSNIADEIKSALISYAQGLEYNDNVYYKRIIDAIEGVEGVSYTDSSSSVYIMGYSDEDETYEEAKQITTIARPASGYLTFLDAEGDSTLTIEVFNSKEEADASNANIKLIPDSIL